MRQRYHLRSRFEADGVFWMPASPQAKFSAHLSARGKLIELRMAAEIAGPQQLFPGRDTAISGVLHGYTTVGTCTLIGVQEHGGVRHFADSSGGVVVARRFRVGLCVLGIHIASYSSPELASATCTYAGTGDWLPTPTELTFTEESTTIIHPHRTPSLVDFCLLANRTRIELRVSYDMTFTPSKRHSASNDRPRIDIEALEPTSLESFYDKALRFENFFSLCVGTSILIRTVQVTNSEGSEGSEGWLVYPRLGKVERPDVPAQIRCSATDLAKSMALWLTISDKLRPLENLIFGIIRNTSMFVETEFLSLAQALESFHRLADPVSEEEPVTSKRVLEEIFKKITSLFTKKATRGRSRYANEPVFKNRIESLLARLSPQHVAELLGDPIVFEQTLRQTRNFYTHPGIKRGSHVLANAKALSLFNQKLHALLRILMLISVGFAEDAVFEFVLYQSRKWS
jgi:ApeA N-terminal domain 1